MAEYSAAFPELSLKQAEIEDVIREEEAAFASMLDRGIKYFDDLTKDSAIKQVSGEQAFYLYDTLGFPVDLTTLMSEEKGLSVDLKGFEMEMAIQKDRSRTAQQAKRLAGRDALTLGAEQTAYLQTQEVKPTDDATKYEWDLTVETTLMAVYTGESSDSSSDGSSSGFFKAYSVSGAADTGDKVLKTVGIVLEKSPFYAEAGGQINDIGQLEVTTATTGDNEGASLIFDVIDVQSYGGYVY